MLKHNEKMKVFLLSCGIKAVPKYVMAGSMRGTWRIYGKGQNWTPELIRKFNEVGLMDFDGKALNQYSGNGGHFQTFVRAPEMLNKFCFLTQ